MALADVLLLNKVDLVTDDELDIVYKRVRYCVDPIYFHFVKEVYLEQ